MPLLGCAIVPLPEPECHELLGWLTGAAGAPGGMGNPRWLLAHCDDGVVWGHRRTPDGSWALSTAVFPAVSPLLRAETLQELRVFDSAEELLVWRTEDRLTGRRLRDAADGQNEETARLDNIRVILGDRRRDGPHGGFTLLADRAGSRHAVPVDYLGDFAQGPPLRLRMRHYLEQHPRTGAVHIAATRLVDLEVR